MMERIESNERQIMGNSKRGKKWIFHEEDLVIECPYCHVRIGFGDRALEVYGYYFMALILDRCPECNKPTRRE